MQVRAVSIFFGNDLFSYSESKLAYFLMCYMELYNKLSGV